MHRWLASWILCLFALPSSAQEFANPERARLAKWHYDKGIDQMRTERWDEAAGEFRTAISHDPLMAMAHYNLGQCRMAQKRYVEAVSAYKGAREAIQSQATLSEKERGARERAREDEIQDLKNDLARLHTLKDVGVEQYRNRIEERIRLLEAIQYRDAGRMEVPAEFSLALGSAYFRQQRIEDAEREYKEAVRINSRLGAAHNNLAAIYLQTGRPDEAEAAVKAAEKCGFPVDPRLKDDIEKARAK